MSIRALTNAAAARRPDFAPFGTVPKGIVEIAAAAGNTPVPAPPAGGPKGAAAPSLPPASGVDTALNLLAGYIPTEILTLYVAVLAAIQHPAGQVSAGEAGAFWMFSGATPIVVWLVFAAKVKAAGKDLPLHPKAWPVWEMFAGAVAYFAWAIALPTNPFQYSNWYSASLAGMIVLCTSTFLGLLAPLFQRPLGT